MSNIYIENRERWLELSSIDYLGAFTKAWLAFNAWYRNAFSNMPDRDIVNAIKHDPAVVVRSKMLPMLVAKSEEAEQLRANIGMLHHRLEYFQIYAGKGTDKERITFTNVYVRDNPSTSANQLMNGITYEVIRSAKSQVTCTVKSKKGTAAFQFSQTKWDLAELQQDSGFAKLNSTQRGCLLGTYQAACPKIKLDLTQGFHKDWGKDPNKAMFGAYSFGCSKEDLYAGVVEVIYQMRCTLFHGELVPSKEASQCYEPAYRLLRHFLQAID